MISQRLTHIFINPSSRISTDRNRTSTASLHTRCSDTSLDADLRKQSMAARPTVTFKEVAAFARTGPTTSVESETRRGNKKCRIKERPNCQKGVATESRFKLTDSLLIDIHTIQLLKNATFTSRIRKKDGHDSSLPVHGSKTLKIFHALLNGRHHSLFDGINWKLEIDPAASVIRDGTS